MEVLVMSHDNEMQNSKSKKILIKSGDIEKQEQQECCWKDIQQCWTFIPFQRTKQ